MLHLTTIILAAFSAAPAQSSIHDLQFLAGHWISRGQHHLMEEIFSSPDGGTVVGFFRWIADDATTLTEHMVIEQHDDGVEFFLRHFHPGSIPWDSEQDGPMRFRLTSVEGDRAVFENPDISFPTHMIYHRTQPDTLLVRLQGRHDDGRPREMNFTYRSKDMTSTTSGSAATTRTLTDAGRALNYDGGLTLAAQVSDIMASIEWYQNVLGFKLMYHVEDMGWCELTTGVDRVNVGLSQVETPKTGAGPVPTFGVKDIDAARKRLEGHGVRFDGPTREIPGMVKLATFYDPDGNALMFYQSLSEEMSGE